MKKTEVKFANIVPLWWNAQSVLINFDDMEDVKVITSEVQTGKESKNLVMSGQADIGIVAAPPLVLGALQKEKGYKVIAKYLEGSGLMGIVSKSSSNGGLNEPIAIVGGTISEFVFHAQAKRHNIDSTKLTTLNSKPPAIYNHLRTNSANSAIIWEPFLKNIMDDELLNLKYKKRANDLYNIKLFLIVNEKSLKNKQKAIEKVIKKFKNLSINLQKDNGKLRGLVEKKFNYEYGYLKDVWKNVQFTFIEDKELIEKDLSEEANIIYDSGKLKAFPTYEQLF